ncbi:MAG: DUF3108 domain-containing protein [Hyphomicrobiales bacterium]
MTPRLRTLALVLVAALGLGAAVACSSDDSLDPTAPIVESIPWTGKETYTYQLSTRGEDDAGTCQLITEPDIEPGHTKLSRLCANDPYRDDGNVIVDSGTLRPVRSERVFVDGKKDRTTTYTTTYQGSEVVFEANVNGKMSDTTRELPEPTDDAPDPAWYDDESLLWLARSLPLRAGFKGTYAHVINAGQPRVLDVDVKVDGTEKVKVGEQEFEAWKVEFRREGTRYLVWVEPAEPHRVLRAQIEDVAYELRPESLASP